MFFRINPAKIININQIISIKSLDENNVQYLVKMANGDRIPINSQLYQDLLGVTSIINEK